MDQGPRMEDSEAPIACTAADTMGGSEVAAMVD